jgi:hypothetical protein
MLATGLVLLHAVPACVGGPDETNLNPQPLPPADLPERGVTDETPGNGDQKGTGSDAPPPPMSGPPDGGSPDASDGGVDG